MTPPKPSLLNRKARRWMMRNPDKPLPKHLSKDKRFEVKLLVKKEAVNERSQSV